jgi:two-component system cell cycle response regulator DivK
MEPLILIVEDDEASFLYLESVLRRIHARILHAENGFGALNMIHNQAITIVLMDLKMPGMDGFEATKRIKAFKPDLPVIAITAYAMSGDEKRALDAGCDDYLTKPLKKELLFSKLELFGMSTRLR